MQESHWCQEIIEGRGVCGKSCLKGDCANKHDVIVDKKSPVPKYLDFYPQIISQKMYATAWLTAS